MSSQGMTVGEHTIKDVPGKSDTIGVYLGDQKLPKEFNLKSDDWAYSNAVDYIRDIERAAKNSVKNSGKD